MDFVDRAPVEIDHVEHRRHVVLAHRLGYARRARVAVAREWSNVPGDDGALLVSFAGHDRRDGAAQSPAFGTVISIAVTHDQRAEIRVAESERAEDVRILRDLRR